MTPTPIETLKARVDALINGHVADVYDTEFARAIALATMARGGKVAVMSAYERLQAKFKREFRLAKLKQMVEDEKLLLQEEANPEPDGFLRTESGVIRAVLANAITALSGFPLAFDTFQQRVVLRGSSPWGSKGPWTDDDDIHCTEYLQRKGIMIENPRTSNAAARSVALKNPFHPVKDWLTSLKWDGTTRLDYWLNTYMGVPESPLTLDFARMWMISAVARIMQPGCKVDTMLVFESEQGVRKSSALRILVNGHADAGKEPFWFRDRIPTLSSDDVGLHMQGVWVIEIAELDAIRRSAAWTATKNFISDQSDTFRRKYGINLQDYPRQCVFAASTNEKEWLGDHTGGRRFWAVPVSNVDLAGLARDRDQLWAEAVALWRRGAPWHLSEEQELVAKQEIASRIPEDVWQERVAAAAEELVLQSTDDEMSISIPDLLDKMKIPAERQGQGEQNRVARVLRALSYEKFRGEVDTRGRRPWRYRKLDRVPVKGKYLWS